MAKSIFEEMGGTYHEENGYLIPNLTLPTKEEKPIGIWGQRHKRYLKEHHRILYYNLFTTCRLNSYLADVNEQVENLFFRLVEQLAEKEGVTEKFKAQDGMKWMQAMNNIRNRVEEVVYSDLIYN